MNAMTDTMEASGYGALVEPTTLRIERLMPGPVDRIWRYLVDSDKRRRWLAAGEMPMTEGASFELTWRNDELTDPPGERPDGFGAEHSMVSRMLAIDPPHRLAFTFGTQSEVEITLEPAGASVRLILIHRRVPDRSFLLNVSAGWHAHLDLLVAAARDERPAAFWDQFRRLKSEYDARLPA
jgi:uncharacterized protein YndB with AHSA1/START domain